MDLGVTAAVGGLSLTLLVLVWRARLALTLFVVRIQSGRVDYVKGRIPPRLLDEIAEVVRLQQAAALVVTCRVENQRASLSFKGRSDQGLEQVLRNLVGQYPLTRLRQAPRSRRSS